MHYETCLSRCDILLKVYLSRMVTCFDLKVKARAGSSGLVRKTPFSPHEISRKMKNENNASNPTGGFKSMLQEESSYFSHQGPASLKVGSGDGSCGIKQSGGQESVGPEAGDPAETCQNKVIASDLPRGPSTEAWSSQFYNSTQET